jgi:hypothetical protein
MHTLKSFTHKLTHWEYWPFGIVHIPIFFVWCYYALKSKSFFYFNATNPSIKNGGFLMESKKEIYDIIPQQYIPKTVFCTQDSTIDTVQNSILEANLQFPIIAKPDIGMKGLAVAKINNKEDLAAYTQNINTHYLLQEFIDYPNEVGIFYYRLPNQEKGTISGIVYKEFLSVTGDSIHTIEQLIKTNPRANFQLQALQLNYGAKLLTILPKGEIFNLVPFGNHSRGAKFIDAKEWITPKLIATIDNICKQIPGFYFGRMDIKYQSLAALENGKHFSIIELNGAGSEPTHIYDPKHSIFFAWREITRHHRIQYQISKQNHQKGYRYLSSKEGMQMLRDNNLLIKKLETCMV